MNRKTNIPSTARILRIEKALTPSSRAWLNHQPRPDRLFGRRVPESLDDLTFGELLGLQEIEGTSNADSIVIVARTVLKTRRPAAWILRTRADRVFGFLAFVTRELERIGKLFKAIEHTPDEDEVAAGVNDLNFGPFGLVDWYARRMGITNQNEVRSVAWVRIFQCMKNDAMHNNFERKLSEQYRMKAGKRK